MKDYVAFVDIPSRRGVKSKKVEVKADSITDASTLAINKTGNSGTISMIWAVWPQKS